MITSGPASGPVHNECGSLMQQCDTLIPQSHIVHRVTSIASCNPPQPAFRSPFQVESSDQLASLVVFDLQFIALYFFFFFFSSRRRHTRCSRDWSSDVCSSD